MSLSTRFGKIARPLQLIPHIYGNSNNNNSINNNLVTVHFIRSTTDPLGVSSRTCVGDHQKRSCSQQCIIRYFSFTALHDPGYVSTRTLRPFVATGHSCTSCASRKRSSVSINMHVINYSIKSMCSNILKISSATVCTHSAPSCLLLIVQPPAETVLLFTMKSILISLFWL